MSLTTPESVWQLQEALHAKESMNPRERKPDARNGHVRFDERGVEPERMAGYSGTDNRKGRSPLRPAYTPPRHSSTPQMQRIGCESGETPKLNTDHGQLDPGFSAGCSSLVVTHQPTMTHQPTESTFHHPASWKHGKAMEIGGTFDYFDLDLRPMLLDPIGKGFAGVTTVNPQSA